MADEFVTVPLGNSFGYRDRKTGRVIYYGPGKNVRVPVQLAQALGFDVSRLTTEQASAAEAEEATPSPPTAAPSEPTSTELPDDFPNADVLVSNGITTLEAIPRSKDELMELEGIGAKRAEEILTALEG